MKTTTKKPIPAQYYNEMVNEMARNIMRIKAAPSMKQARIDEVLASGMDYEEMLNGALRVPLSKLQEYKRQADEELKTLDAKIAEWKKYKATHEPIKGLKGDLRAARIEAKYKKLKYPAFRDPNYDFYHALCCRYYLTDKQAEQLMDTFCELDLY